MKKIVVFALAVALTQVVFAQDSTVRKLDELMTAFTSVGRFNGAVLVAQHGKILLQKGYGIKNAEDKSTNDVSTRFQVASVTKQFTSAVILKLVELHKMALNDKLSKYYRDFPNGDVITVEHLLTHTSGLRNFTEEDSSINTAEELKTVQYFERLKPDFAPGTDWHYSNSGYVLLSYIIQQVSGMSYWQAVRKYIFTPLKMNNSGFDFIHVARDKKATGYDFLMGSSRQPADITDSTGPFGAGAIYSTVTDMYKWHLGLQAYKVVNKKWMDKAYTPCALHNYGYGWQIDSVYGRKMVSHSGSISGFGSNFARIPEDDICVVLLSNKSGSTGEVMHITDKLLAVLYHQPYSIPVKLIPVAIEPAVLKKYIGTYTIEEIHLTVDVTAGDGILIAQPKRDGHPGPTSLLHPLSAIYFYDEHDEDLKVTIDIDAAGEVKGLKILQKGVTKYANKIK
ncbi:MAG: serine hydrolase [Ferruginibacter sp.]|uniref:serine hydrolase domain-containing protein n=1 Tax=Ferruginibacter sp. TaxID=1940288 RepID=UPI002658EBBD|nr:serine hydrolase domain-containing protein [Ferruginibacter sp.]MDB5279139.1 serine hydrolase [Ferruginibacter sp.]